MAPNDPELDPLNSKNDEEEAGRTSLDDGDAYEEVANPPSKPSSKILSRYCIAFFLFGLLNNVLYVIVLSAALDLVPADVPKGVVLLVNIAPSLVAKMGWPYISKGTVRYRRRIMSCATLSFCGMIIVAIFPSIGLRLSGIALASFSSGLGEMTYLQLSTSYGDDFLGTKAVGWFASGTGAAGIVGAGLWWVLRGLGVRFGLGMSSVLPVCMALTYTTLLPPRTHLASASSSATNTAYTPLPTSADDSMAPPTSDFMPVAGRTLTWEDKKALAKPLVWKYMAPLFLVYLAEYTINTGVAPGLIYPIPNRDGNPVFSHIVHSLRDYYPLWQLTYQTFVFFSRSSISIFHLPPLPRRLIPLPSLFQLLLLLLAISESSVGSLSTLLGPNWILPGIFLLVSFEGIFGGLAYVGAYHWLGVEGEGGRVAEREFRIACVGFADTCGILMASLVSSWLEPTLCGIQVERGRTLCKEV